MTKNKKNYAVAVRANLPITLRVKLVEWQAAIRLFTYGPGSEPKLARKLINRLVLQVGDGEESLRREELAEKRMGKEVN